MSLFYKCWTLSFTKQEIQISSLFSSTVCVHTTLMYLYMCPTNKKKILTLTTRAQHDMIIHSLMLCVMSYKINIWIENINAAPKQPPHIQVLIHKSWSVVTWIRDTMDKLHIFHLQGPKWFSLCISMIRWHGDITSWKSCRLHIPERLLYFTPDMCTRA